MRSSADRVAVVGAGIFGVTCALKLAERGYEVTLFERHRKVLQAASGINQYRLHRGYHYPRSDETAAACRDSSPRFRSEFPEAVRDEAEHYYVIAARDSLTTPEGFLEFCDRLELEYEEAWPDVIRSSSCGLAVRVREALFDPVVLRTSCEAKLARSGLEVRLGTAATPRMLDEFAFVVVATYARLNELLEDDEAEPLQFELCEKPVVRLPAALQGISVVVMDGPFMCIDPLSDSGLSVMGNVVHALHHTSVGLAPKVDQKWAALLDRGVVPPPSGSRFPEFLEAAVEFFPGIEAAEHVGSMFTVRTVLPNRDATDERPTIVRQVRDNFVTVFSGKVGTCVEAADVVAGRADTYFGRRESRRSAVGAGSGPDSR